MLTLCSVMAFIACGPAEAGPTAPPTDAPAPLGTTSPAPAPLGKTPPAPDATPAETPAGIPETTTLKTLTTLTTPPASKRKAAPRTRQGSLTKEDPPPKGQSENQQQGRPYTWQDGDRTITALLQEDLTVDGNGRITEREPTGQGSESGIGQRDENEDPAAPVFRSNSGSLMTLPGGVMLALDETWTKEQTDAFFQRNSIETSRVSRLDYLANGFFIETGPGFPSLNLANSLAQQDSVIASSPNWSQEVSTK